MTIHLYSFYKLWGTFVMMLVRVNVRGSRTCKNFVPIKIRLKKLDKE